jgi:hypothetical protein
MVKNPATGEIAIKWVLNRPVKTIKIDGTDQYYVFKYQFHVAMEWVKPEHVDRVLSIREKTCNCNNGTYQNAFAPASLQDVCVWTAGDRCKGTEEWIEV